MKIIPIVIGVGMIASILLLLIAFIFMKNQVRPIKKLSKEVTDFGKGLDNPDYKPEGALEIRAVGLAFCQMKSKIKELMNNKMTILAGISHDLRTPLTKMKLQLSLMPKTKETNWLMDDVNFMIDLTESFTLHAFEEIKEPFEKVNLFDFIGTISQRHLTNDFKVNIDGMKDVPLYVKKTSLNRAFGNIFSNSQKYSNNMYVKISQSEDEVIVYFEDDGPGIPNQSNLEEIFLPFKTLNTARTHSNLDNGLGVGLGLSIARDAINAHGGSISAKNSEKYGGACFIVKLPF